MLLTRRRLLGSTAALGALGLAGCADGSPAPTAAPAITDAPTLLTWMAAHPDQWSLAYDDGRGTAFDHQADRTRPLASATKVVHLAAYARAVATGALDPAATLTVEDWERWYVPGTDGSAHPNALQALGSPSALTWDQLAAVMIDVSDNAAPDRFREELGDQALRDAGWAGYDVPSLAGESLLALAGARPDPAVRRADADSAGRAYAADPAARAARAEAARQEAAAAGRGDSGADAAPDRAAGADAGWPAQLAFWSGSPGGTARDLAALHLACARADLGVPGAGEIARTHLERGLVGRIPPDVVGMGQKGGSLPGIVTHGVSARRTDGSIGTCALLLSDLSVDTYLQVLESSAFLLVAQGALLDPAARDALAAVV